MNQTDFLKKKHSSNNSSKKIIRKKKSKINGKKFATFIIITFLSLCVVFAASFYFSYRGLTKDRAKNADANTVIKEQREEIAKLNTLISEKDTQIEDLTIKVEMYKKQVEDLKKQDVYSQEISKELDKLRKDKVHVVEMPVIIEKEEEGTSENSEEDFSKVQEDLYSKNSN